MTDPIEDITARRQALRREMLARRAALSVGEHQARSMAIVSHLLAAFSAPRLVGFCWPIKQEPDVRAVLAEWRKQGTAAALPVVVAPDSPLAFRHWSPDSPLIADRYGIPAPSSGAFVQPDLLLIPLNAFDARGYRLGYGGGYFDRTLAAMQPRPLAIGVGFELNRVDSIEPQAHDLPLDGIVTEAGVFRMGGEKR